MGISANQAAAEELNKHIAPKIRETLEDFFTHQMGFSSYKTRIEKFGKVEVYFRISRK